MSNNPVNKKTFLKTIQTTQAIEGYQEANKETKQKAKLLMKNMASKYQLNNSYQPPI